MDRPRLFAGLVVCLALVTDTCLAVIRFDQRDGSLKMLKGSRSVQKRDVSAITKCTMPPSELTVPPYQVRFRRLITHREHILCIIAMPADVTFIFTRSLISTMKVTSRSS